MRDSFSHLHTLEQPRAKGLKDSRSHPIPGRHLSQRMAGIWKHLDGEVLIPRLSERSSHVLNCDRHLSRRISFAIDCEDWAGYLFEHCQRTKCKDMVPVPSHLI